MIPLVPITSRTDDRYDSEHADSCAGYTSSIAMPKKSRSFASSADWSSDMILADEANALSFSP